MRKVSFKISKNGTRYCHKAKPNPSVFVDKEADDTTSSNGFKPHHHHQLVPARVQCDIDLSKKRSVVDIIEDDDDEDTEEIPDAEVSFIVNIFPDGYTIDKTLESIAAHQIAKMYNPKLVRPYDRASQSLFKAIKCCRVPMNFFEDIPCNYKNGKVACEVRDWRKDSSEQAGVSINGPPSIAATPSIRRIYLRMPVDSIVRDIPQMSKRDFWPNSELLEAEAKILLALYPKLDLNPYPNFDRLCKKPKTVKLNLDFRAMRRKRLRQMSVPEKSNLGTDQPNVANPATQNFGQRTAMGPPNSVNLAAQNVHQIPTMHQLTQNVRQLPRTAFNAPGASSTHALVNLSSNDDDIQAIMSAFEGGSGNQDSRQSSSMADSDQQQKIASHNALGASSSTAGASSTRAMQNASTNQDRQSSFMANSNNRNWRDPLPLVGNRQHMTLEILDNTPGTAFSALRASSTRSRSLPSANDGRRSFVSAFDGRTVNQDSQSSSSMAYLDGRRSRSNSLVFLGNQQQPASHMQYNAARTSVNAPGAFSSDSMTNLNSNNGSTIPFDGNKGNQDSHSSSLVKMENMDEWSNPLHNQNTSSAPGASSTHDIMSLNSNNVGKMGNQDVGHSSSVANLDNRNWSNPLVYVGYQQPKIEPHMPDHAQRTALGVPGASPTHSMIDLTTNNDDLSSILFGLDDKSRYKDGQSSFMANADNINQSNPLAIITVPVSSSTQGTVSLSSDDDIDIRAILSATDGKDCSPMPNKADNKLSNPLASVGSQQQQIAANQQHGMVSSGSDDDNLWSIMSAFNNKRGQQDGQSSSMAKRNRLNPSSSTIGSTSGLSSAGASVQRELDRRMQDRFTKIGLLTARYNLNCKELKVDDYQPTINIPSSQLNHELINSNDNETLIDETCKMPLSMSHAGGNVNLCKTRIMKFVKEAYSHRAGDAEIPVPKSETKLILSERQHDGTVTMHYCEFDDYDHSSEEKLLPTFPNTHMADMFAAEFCSLMEREGYSKEGDYLQMKPVSVVQLSDVQCKRAIGPSVIAGGPYPVGYSTASLCPVQ